jgi:hypothetical protein
MKNRIVFKWMPFYLKTAFNSFIISAKSKPLKKFYFEAIGTGFITGTIINGNSIRVKNLPKNLSFKVSNW